MTLTHEPSRPAALRLWRPGWRLAASLACIAALSLRLPGGPTAFPPGLYRDEAWYGLDAAATIAEGMRLWYSANNGREPLFIWLVAPLIRLLGQTPAAVRLPSAWAGTVATAAGYAFGSRMLGRRAGAVMAWCLAVMPWSVLTGRTGFRAALLPAVLLVAAAAAARAAGSHASPAALHVAARANTRERWALLSGAVSSLSLYTYTAARALPVLLLLAAPMLVIAEREASDRTGGLRAASRRCLRPIGAFVIAAVLTSLPMAWQLAREPGALTGRLSQVAIYSDPGSSEATASEPGDVVSGGEAGENVPAALAGGARATAEGLARTAGLFVVRGDSNPRHNVPGRPALGWLGAGWWVIGVLWVAAAALPPRRSRSKARAAVRGAGAAGAHLRVDRRREVRIRLSARLALAWTLAFALPTALAEDAPHFLRGIGLLPMAALLLAAGVERGLRAVEGLRDAGNVRPAIARRLTAVIWATVGAALLLESRASAGRMRTVAASARFPIVADSASLDAYFAFEGAAAGLALQINRELGYGWRGGWAVAPGASPRSEDKAGIWLDRRLRDGWTSLPYLVPLDAVRLADPYDPVLERVGGTAWLVPEDLELDAVWSRLPEEADLSLKQGLPERGDRSRTIRTMWVRARAVPRGASAPSPEPTAVFENGFELVGAQVAADGPRLTVATGWLRSSESTEDDRAMPITRFVHLMEPGGQQAGDDAAFGMAVYPPDRWRPGQVVTETVDLPLVEPFDAHRHWVEVGLYVWPSTDRVPVIDVDGSPVGDAAVIAGSRP